MKHQYSLLHLHHQGICYMFYESILDSSHTSEAKGFEYYRQHSQDHHRH